jgi:hypothetical protein
MMAFKQDCRFGVSFKTFNKELSTENCQFNKINNKINNNKINNKPNKISNKNNSTEQDPCKDQNINQSIEEQLITSAKSIEKSLAHYEHRTHHVIKEIIKYVDTGDCGRFFWLSSNFRGLEMVTLLDQKKEIIY